MLARGRQQRLLLLTAAAVLLVGLVPPARGDAEAENTPLSQLATHDGMVIFNGAPRLTIPPNATAATAAAAQPCVCSDAPPRDTSTRTPPYLVTTDCFFQAQYGNCNASFMQSYLTELVFNDGFCQISCGRCPCCSDPATVLRQLGAKRFLQALEVAQPSLLDLLAHPGWTGTLLVPTDAAFDAALAKYGTALQDPAILQQILKFHMLGPEPRTRGLWTTPFMAVGARLWTLADTNVTIQSAQATLPAGTTANGGLTGLVLKGPLNNARVVGPSDLMACKAYLTVIDSVLMPFDPTPLVSLGVGTDPLGAALAGGQCALQANAGLNATSLQPGAANRQRSVGQCCASCQRAVGCNAFQFCAQRGGCMLGNGTAIPYGSCELMHDADVAEGQPPAWADWGATTPLLSGYAISTPTVPAAGRRMLSLA